MMSTSETEIKAEIKEEISDGFSTEDQRAFEIAQNFPIPMLSTAKVEIKPDVKNEIKEEIHDGFSTEDQRAFEIIQNLPMPKIPSSSVRNISRAQGDTLTKRRLRVQIILCHRRKELKLHRS